MATGLEVQPLGVERSAKPYLEKVVVFPVGPQLETDISLDLHGVSLLKSWPKNGPKMLKGEQRHLQRYAIESIPARVCEGVRSWFTILVLSAEMPCRTPCGAFLVKSIPKTENLRQKKLLAGGQLSEKKQDVGVIGIHHLLSGNYGFRLFILAIKSSNSSSEI